MQTSSRGSYFYGEVTSRSYNSQRDYSSSKVCNMCHIRTLTYDMSICNLVRILFTTRFKATGEMSSYPEEVVKAVMHFSISKLVAGYRNNEKFGESRK